MVDIGTLERIQELKETYGIGSFQAWRYLKTENDSTADGKATRIFSLFGSETIGPSDTPKIDERGLGRYERGLLEQTLHMQEVERQIAFNYILCQKSLLYDCNNIHIRKLIEKDGGLIPHLLRNLKNEISAYRLSNEKGDRIFRLALEIGFRKLGDFSQSHSIKNTFKSAKDVIYPLLRGSATYADYQDYIVRRDQYIIRAIEENMDWLRDMLT